MAINPQQAYQQNQITTASPRELVLLLYNAGIKHLTLAKNAINQKEYEKAHQALIRSQDICTELILGLDHKVELAIQLEVLYNYMKDQMIKANISKDVTIIEEVLGMFVEFRDTWKQAIELAKNPVSAQGVQNDGA